MGMELKLFCFSLPEKTKKQLYVFSIRCDEPWLRNICAARDHGSMKWEDYHLLYTEGKISLVTSLNQVPQKGGWRNGIPLNSDELDNNLFDLTIKDYFELANTPEYTWNQD